MAVKTRKATETKVLRGLNLNGVVRVFSKVKTVEVKGKQVTFINYWTNISRKREDGEYDQKGITLLFGKDADQPEHNADIRIIDAFMTLDGKEAFQRPAIFVKEWDYEEVTKK